MPTLDYFLSSDLMEPPDAAEHYTGQLIRLPNLSFLCADRDGTSVHPREELNLRSDATVSGAAKRFPISSAIRPRICGIHNCWQLPICVFESHKDSKDNRVIPESA
jgi:hypothetical protein